MPSLNTFYDNNSNAPGLLLTNEYLSALNAIKDETVAFTQNQLIAWDAANEYCVPFTWTAGAADFPLIGICVDATGADEYMAYVVNGGVLMSDLIDVANVEDNTGANAGFTLADLITYINANGGNIQELPYATYACNSVKWLQPVTL